MIPLKELIGHLQASADTLPARLHEQHEKNARIVAAEAAEYVGHELPEWPPLAQATVDEKTDLGYVGHVSATDPGLRTGEMREINKAADHQHQSKDAERGQNLRRPRRERQQR